MKSLILLLFFMVVTTGPARALENVVATIAPLHSLVAGVMGDTGVPLLLVPPSASPHNYNLRPSQATALQSASIIFRVSRSLEIFLERPLQALAAKARIVSAIEAPGLTLFNFRVVGDEPASHAPARHHEHEADPHVWLDPGNARKIVAEIAAALSAADRRNTALYRRNSAQLQARLANLQRDMADKLTPLQGVPFVTLLDSFQYIEFRFQMNNVGFLATAPDLPAGAGHTREIRADLESGAVACVFSEPQAGSKQAESLVDGTNARVGELDPLGARLTPGPELYFELMARNLNVLQDCLGR